LPAKELHRLTFQPEVHCSHRVELDLRERGGFSQAPLPQPGKAPPTSVPADTPRWKLDYSAFTGKKK
jgi:hypothetical protein